MTIVIRLLTRKIKHFCSTKLSTIIFYLFIYLSTIIIYYSKISTVFMITHIYMATVLSPVVISRFSTQDFPQKM